jgi:hypothetical protein
VNADLGCDIEFFNRIGQEPPLAALPLAVIHADDGFLERQGAAPDRGCVKTIEQTH